MFEYQMAEVGSDFLIAKHYITDGMPDKNLLEYGQCWPQRDDTSHRGDINKIMFIIETDT